MGNGSSTSMWKDLWDFRIPEYAFPELYSFAKRKNWSVMSEKAVEDLVQLFHLPLSSEAFMQLPVILDALEHNAITQDPNTWTYIWGSHLFTPLKAYKHLTGNMHIHPCYTWLWKSAAQHKHKVFFWLLIKDRLSTRNLLRRRNMELPSYNCVLCTSSVEETTFHLFLECPFAQQCWLLLQLHVSDPMNLFASLEAFKYQLHIPFFMDVIILLSWCIWMERNVLIFRNIIPSVQNCKERFCKEFALVILRAKNHLPLLMSTWIDTTL